MGKVSRKKTSRASRLKPSRKAVKLVGKHKKNKKKKRGDQSMTDSDAAVDPRPRHKQELWQLRQDQAAIRTERDQLGKSLEERAQRKELTKVAAKLEEDYKSRVKQELEAFQKARPVEEWQADEEERIAEKRRRKRAHIPRNTRRHDLALKN